MVSHLVEAPFVVEAAGDILETEGDSFGRYVLSGVPGQQTQRPIQEVDSIVIGEVLGNWTQFQILPCLCPTVVGEPA